MSENLSDKEKYDLKKVWEANPDFYHRSQADKKKYGEKRLVEMNRETLRQIEEHNRKIFEERKNIGREIEQVLKEEAKYLKRGRSVFFDKHYKDA